MQMILLSALLVTGCTSKAGAGNPDGCPRDHTWRDPVDVSSGAATVLITQDCADDMVVTEATLQGAGFAAELPAIGDILTGTWEIEVTFDTEQVTEPGDYSGILRISADQLVEDSLPKDLTATVQ